MIITTEMLAKIFAESNLFCGKEDVLHALIYYQLSQAGFPYNQIAREQLINKYRSDIVLYSPDVRGDFESTKKDPLVVIEVKGGAYGDRNALKDTVDASGYCFDMSKLQVESSRGIEAWFICVDMAELGRAISPSKIQLVSEQCTRHGLAFAYYCQGEEKFYVSSPQMRLTTRPISETAPTYNSKGLSFLLQEDNKLLNSLANNCREISGHEANYTVLLYDCLRRSGFGVAQLSLETYFSFAAQRSKMQDRPDLVVFNRDFDGRFNLYKNGNRSLSNDQHKLSHIETIFEVKGGSAMSKKSSNAIMKDYISDIKKLRRWCDLAKISHNSTKLQPIFFGVDLRATGFSDKFLDVLGHECRNEHVNFIYISHDRIKTIQVL